VKAVVTADHPVTAAIRGDLTAREALAELTADGMLIAAGQGLSPGAARSCFPSNCRVRCRAAPATAPACGDLRCRPAAARLRQQGLWAWNGHLHRRLATLGLDPRTERSLREAIESYRRGVFLAASSLLGAAVEGAWYAAGQRMRSTAPQVDPLVDGDRTAQLQGAVAAALRDVLPGNRRWEADALSSSPASCAISETTASNPGR